MLIVLFTEVNLNTTGALIRIKKEMKDEETGLILLRISK
jgi:hypothetical protein